MGGDSGDMDPGLRKGKGMGGRGAGKRVDGREGK